jgi:phosphate transport system protein
MERQFELELDELKQRLLTMGSLAERALQQAIYAVSQSNERAARRVIDEEVAINKFQIEVDVRVLQLVARYQLMASDLRFALAVGRINGELERIGDQAVNIAQAAQRILQRPQVAVGMDILWMSNLTEGMLRDSLDAFARSNLEIARSVMKRDDQLDALRDRLMKELLGYMVSNPPDIMPTFDRILVTKSLERVGDHATNIAEDVIYFVAGDDVRHNARDQKQNRKES